MKKMLFLSAAALIAAVSCSKEPETPAVQVGEPVSFIATVDGAGTRTVLGDNYTPMWSGEEWIQIVGKNGNYWLGSETETPSSSAVFTYNGDNGEYNEEDVMAVYPAGSVSYGKDYASKTVRKLNLPTNQNAVSGSYDPSAAISMAYSADNVLKFKNVVSLIRFTVGNEGVTKAGLYNEDGVQLTGDFDVSYNEGNPKVSAADGYYTNVFAGIQGNLEKGGTYYIAVLPANLANGFTFEYVVDGVTRSLKTTAALNIARNKVIDLGTVTIDEPAVEKRKVYFKPNEGWKADGAKFGAHFWSPDADVVMTDADGDGIYEAEVAKSLNNVIFVRLASDAEAFGWGGYQTADLTVENECYALGYSGNAGEWMTLEAAKTYVPEAPAAKEGYLYLKPNSNWLQAGARFAACFLGEPQIWLSMDAAVGTEYYECRIPEGRTQVIFCRMDPKTSDNNWNNKWNQTGDLNIPADGKNLYSVPDTWWDTSADETNGISNWTKYE